VLKASRGFSLVELLVGMAIFGVLMALALPSYSGWIRNAKIRTTAESVQNGLQLAKAEAVRRNTVARFQLIDLVDNSCDLNSAGPHWVVSLDSVVGKCGSAASDTTDPRIVQLRGGAEGSDENTKLAATRADDETAQNALVFNGMGRLMLTPSGSVNIDVFNSAPGAACLANGGKVRCLRVVITVGGQIRMCDPALPSGDTQACS
jgi:type IV fimbrial biogenesis protein FimT